jgi:hypothetical protein
MACLQCRVLVPQETSLLSLQVMQSKVHLDGLLEMVEVAQSDVVEDNSQPLVLAPMTANQETSVGVPRQEDLALHPVPDAAEQ